MPFFKIVFIQPYFDGLRFGFTLIYLPGVVEIVVLSKRNGLSYDTIHCEHEHFYLILANLCFQAFPPTLYLFVLLNYSIWARYFVH